MLGWINKKRKRKGFTLVELVVVIAILGILAGIAVPRLSKSRYEAEKAAMEATVRTLNSAISMYIAHEGETEKLKEAENGYAVYKLLVDADYLQDTLKDSDFGTGENKIGYDGTDYLFSITSGDK